VLLLGLVGVLLVAIGGGILVVRWAWAASRPDLVIDYIWRPRVVERVVTPAPEVALGAVVEQKRTTTPAALSATDIPEVQVSSGAVVTATWQEVDFHPAGDKQDVVNVDHKGLPRVTISWYFAGPGDKAPTEACTVHVTTHPKGERITFLGAFRTWEWTGATGASPPTKEQIRQLVADWIKVLEAEPRGACAKRGAYRVTWQDPSLATP